jgi:hypothetical protein
MVVMRSLPLSRSSGGLLDPVQADGFVVRDAQFFEAPPFELLQKLGAPLARIELVADDGDGACRLGSRAKGRPGTRDAGRGGRRRAHEHRGQGISFRLWHGSW